MPHIIEITDLSAPEPDVFARLTGARLRGRRTPERTLFITESLKVIDHALGAGYEPVSLLMEHRQLEGPARSVLAHCGGVPLYTAGRDTLAALTDYELTRGVLCAMRCPSLPAVEELCASAKRMAVLKSIVDPTNVRAIFRSVAALHMDGMPATPTCYDPLHHQAMRVSMGTVFRIPWTYTGTHSVDWPQPELARLRALGFQAAAMALSLRTLSIEDSRLVSVKKLAIAPGAERDGLSPRTVAHCDYTVCIPMARGVGSLNVAAASAVAFWQLGQYK